MQEEKTLVAGLALLVVTGLVSCQGATTVSTSHRINPPIGPPVDVKLTATIGGGSGHELTPNPSFVGLCLINEYWDIDGNPTGTTSQPITGTTPLGGPIPSGSVFWMSTIGPWEQPEGSSPPIVPRLTGLHEFTAYGGRVAMDIAESNVGYSIQVVASDYDAAKTLIEAIAAAGPGAPLSPLVVDAYLTVLEPDPGGDSLTLRVASLGKAIEDYELFLNGTLYASSTLGLNTTVTTSNGWIIAESVIDLDDIVTGTTAGETYQNLAHIEIDTDDTPTPWEVDYMFEHTP